jgi:release factor glutamine methyltransferase
MVETLQDALRRSETRLSAALGLTPDESRREARILLGHALQRPPSYVVAHSAERLDTAPAGILAGLLERRLNGEPLAYILGEREFYSLSFRVGPPVLIPRPETELLVDLALSLIPEDTPWQVLDLGTGSGAVAITLARHRPRAGITAVDQSPAALAVARENARRLGTDNVRFLVSDWYGALAGRKFHLIVSNPPYVQSGDPHLARGDVRFEPPAALIGGADGLDCIRTIVAGAAPHLSAGGWLLFEHGYDQAETCRALLRENGFTRVASHLDLAGIPRVTGGRLA